jgi:arginine deiminase
MGEMLEKYGKQVLRPNLGEIAKGDGSGRCSSAPLNRD